MQMSKRTMLKTELNAKSKVPSTKYQSLEWDGHIKLLLLSFWAYQQHYCEYGFNLSVWNGSHRFRSIIFKDVLGRKIRFQLIQSYTNCIHKLEWFVFGIIVLPLLWHCFQLWRTPASSQVHSDTDRERKKIVITSWIIAIYGNLDRL